MKLLALVLFLAAPAVHADADAWKGSYAGVNVGGARAHSTWRTDATSGPPAAETVDQTAGSGIIGGQLGYRFAASEHLLLGLELQGHAAKIEARDPSTYAAGRERVTTVRDPVSAAVQVGLAGSSTLAYLRGGYAYATIELEAINQLSGNVAAWDHHATGWTAGAGFEVLLRPKWTLGLQYDYYKLRAVNLSTVNSGGVTVEALNFEARIQALHVRTSIRF